MSYIPVNDCLNLIYRIKVETTFLNKGDPQKTP